MEEKRNLFDVMEEFIPEDRLLAEDCRKADIRRIKTKVFQKKGTDLMKICIVKRTAAAILAVVLLAGGAVGVDAATGGHVIKKVKETWKAEQQDVSKKGTTTTYKKDGFLIKEKKEKDGDICITIEDAEKGQKTGNK